MTHSPAGAHHFVVAGLRYTAEPDWDNPRAGKDFT